MSHYWETGVLVGEKSWHGLEKTKGELLPDGAGEGFNIFASMQKHGADYNVEKLPIGIVLPDGKVYQTGDDYAIARPPALGYPDWNILRTAKDRYEPIQNLDLANVVQPLIDSGLSLRGWAVLKAGEITFIQLDLPEFTVGGKDDELHQPKLLVSNDHRQGSAKWGEVITRVVCANTHAIALREEGIESIPHNSTTSEELDFRVRILEAIHRAQESEKEFLNALFTRKITNEEVEDSIRAIFPDPKPSRKMKLAVAGQSVGVEEHSFLDIAGKDFLVFNQQKERTEKLRSAVRDAFGQFNADHAYAGDTAYGLFQSVTNVTNHSTLFTGSAEKNAISLIWGNKAQINEQAHSVVAELVK